MRSAHDAAKFSTVIVHTAAGGMRAKTCERLEDWVNTGWQDWLVQKHQATRGSGLYKELGQKSSGSSRGVVDSWLRRLARVTTHVPRGGTNTTLTRGLCCRRDTVEVRGLAVDEIRRQEDWGTGQGFGWGDSEHVKLWTRHQV